MKYQLDLRPLIKSDAQIISNAFQAQGWTDKPASQYEKYFEYQEKGEREVIVALANQQFAGYLTIKWISDYLPFQQKEIPEIVDFNVLERFRRLGIGTSLMDEAERRIKTKSLYAGIGVGVYKDYGAAQVLYAKRGYIPDGNGLVRNSSPIAYNETITIGHDIVFCLTKKLV